MITILWVGKLRPGTEQSLYGVEESDQGVWWFRASREVSVWLCLPGMGVLGGCPARCCVPCPRPMLPARELVMRCFRSPLDLVASQPPKGIP